MKKPNKMPTSGIAKFGFDVGDTLSQGLQGLAEWIGMGSLIGEWQSAPFKKIKKQLNDEIQKALNDGSISQEDLTNKISELNLKGVGIIGDSANKVGQYKEQMKNILNSKLDDSRIKTFNAQKDLIELEKADDMANRLGPSYKSNAEQTYYDLANKYNI